MTKQEIHYKLVHPVCALEEYCRIGADSSPIVYTLTMALRHILDEIEDDMYNEVKEKKK